MSQFVHLRLGDCVAVMAGMADDSIRAIVSDPPYGLEFMGKDWDHLEGANYANIIPGNNSPHARRHSVNYLGSPNPTCRNCGGLRSLLTEGSGGRKKCRCDQPDFPNYRTPAMQAQQAWHLLWLEQAYRVLMPGGVLKAFSGTRTFHRLAMAMEEAGFVDVELGTGWAYGSGFPKSLNVSKSLDQMQGFTPKVVGSRQADVGMQGNNFSNPGKAKTGTVFITEAVSEDAKRFEGYGTALKPSWEPVITAQKPE